MKLRSFKSRRAALLELSEDDLERVRGDGALLPWDTLEDSGDRLRIAPSDALDHDRDALAHSDAHGA
jgi:hypothetical protein